MNRLLEVLARALLRSAMWRLASRYPITWVVAAGLLLWALSSGVAHAQSIPAPGCNSMGQPTGAGATHYCSRQLAWQACDVSRSIEEAGGWTAICSQEPASPAVPVLYRCTRPSFGACNSDVFRIPTPECPSGTVWDESTKQCKADCATAAPYGPATTNGGGFMCHSGCRYQPQGVFACLEGTQSKCFAGSWTPTGAACQAGDPGPESYDPEKDMCRTIAGGSYMECIKPNGDHCVTTPRGTRLCNPSSLGPNGVDFRNSADGKEGSSRGQQGTNPPPPPGMENPQQQSSSNSSINNNSYVTNVYSGSGSQGTQSNTGPGGKDAGTGEGSGDGDGEGDGDGTASGGATCAAAPNCAGDPIQCAVLSQAWYLRCDGNGTVPEGDLGGGEDEGPDMGSVDAVGDKSIVWDKLTDVPDLDDSGFVGGGQCPTFSVPEINGIPIGIDFSKMCDLLANVGNLVMACAYMLGIRIITGSK